MKKQTSAVKSNIGFTHNVKAMQNLLLRNDDYFPGFTCAGAFSSHIIMVGQCQVYNTPLVCRHWFEGKWLFAGFDLFCQPNCQRT